MRSGKPPSFILGSIPLLIIAFFSVWVSAKVFSRGEVGRELIGPREGPGFQLRGWDVEIAGAEDAQMAGFRGFYGLGEVIFIPEGESFVLASSPFGIPGRFGEENQRREWKENGGDLSESPGQLQTSLIAPQRHGPYSLSFLSREEPALGGPILRILVLARAEMRGKGRDTELWVSQQKMGLYLDPIASGIEKVKANAVQYDLPRYFAQLTPETMRLKIGVGLELGQMIAFIDERDAQGHKVITDRRHTLWFPPSRPLIQKLNQLQKRLNERGYGIGRFWITSGFRNPMFNKAIGGAAFSRHCYGDAVDLCVDQDGDLHMDDLNKDGQLNRHDGLIIAKACEELEEEGAVAMGGIGVYEWIGQDSVRCHLHLDCRGFPARWGQTDRGGRKAFFEWSERSSGENKSLRQD